MKESPFIRFLLKQICAMTLCVMLFALGYGAGSALALEIKPGDRITLNAERAIGVPLHEFAKSSLIDRAADGSQATVIKLSETQRWIKIRLEDGREAWIVDRYLDTSQPAASPQNPSPKMPNGPILLDLKGKSLLNALAKDYAPKRSLGYGRARDILYTQIDNQNGMLRTLYSGFEAPVDPNAEKPRQAALAQGINAEHVWPQSLGATGAAKSDLHHLFPARAEVNGDRSNFPFAEIPDRQSISWYLDDDELNEIPAPDEIDLYSEGKRGAFEPRESKKGDIARAIFYFKAIYPDQDPKNFFKPQQSTLCAWDQNDPVDAQEQERSHAIALTPQGNENPFVLDPSLSTRTFCK